MKKLNQARAEAKKAGMTEGQISNRIRGPATEMVDVPDNQRYDGRWAIWLYKNCAKRPAAGTLFRCGRFHSPALALYSPKEVLGSL